ncbi:MAG: transglutaminase family protein, partial [Caulobacteraceae bacterium]|nr:transglutaminase family protein [Caulobacteraceae bacterium]
MAILEIRHLTRYLYRRPVAFGEHRMMLRPAEGFDQRVLAWELDIRPAPARLANRLDVFGNCVSVATFDERAPELVFDSRVRLEQTCAAAPPCDIADADFTYDEDEQPDLARSIERGWPDSDGAVARWARAHLAAGPLAIDVLAAMTVAVRREFTYRSRLTVGVQPPEETL